ncbi:MAG TPA: hypothetical protein VF586_04880 [Pyrinomonadaceae bacterium]|jgi:hypothetical protein
MGQTLNDQHRQEERPPGGPSERERRESVRQYILGELSEEGREQVERRLISQDDYFEELLIAEEELADDFVGERLTDPALTAFRRSFLSVPELRQDVRFAKALRRHAAEHAQRQALQPADGRPPPLLARISSFFRQPAVGFALAAALLLAVCSAAWMAVQNGRLREQVAQLRAREAPRPTPQTESQAQLALERERGEQLAARLGREQEQRAEAERRLEEAVRQQARSRREQTTGPATGSVPAVFTLTPGLVRGEGEGQKRIPPPPPGDRLIARLDLAANEYRSYRASLQTLDGKELHSLPNLRARAGGGGMVIPFPLPAARLAPGNDYQIVLSGKAPDGAYEEVGTYYFRVLR